MQNEPPLEIFSLMMICGIDLRLDEEAGKKTGKKKSKMMLKIYLLIFIQADIPTLQSKKRFKQVITVPCSDAGSLCKE